MTAASLPRARDVILARRALFVSSTVAFFGCPAAAPTVLPPPVGTVSVPTATGEPAPLVEPTARPRTEARRPWSAVMADAPPLAPPAAGSIEASEREALVAVETDLRPRYEALGQVWDDAPVDCSLAASGCTTRWLATLEKLDEIGDAAGAPLCGWNDALPMSAIQRRNAHSGFVQRTIELLRGELAAAAKDHGQTASWDALRSGRLMLRPCLSCIAPPPRVRVEVRFAAGASGLDAPAEQALRHVKDVLERSPALRVQIRGHVDAAEPGDPLSLSRQRAAAVASALVKLGVAAGRLTTVALGNALPIEAPSRGADNRRVDFERMP